MLSNFTHLKVAKNLNKSIFVVTSLIPDSEDDEAGHQGAELENELMQLKIKLSRFFYLYDTHFIMICFKNLEYILLFFNWNSFERKSAEVNGTARTVQSYISRYYKKNHINLIRTELLD